MPIFRLGRCAPHPRPSGWSFAARLPASRARGHWPAPRNPPLPRVCRYPTGSVPLGTLTNRTAPLLPLATTNLSSVSSELPVLDATHKQNHTACGRLCLALFPQHPPLSAYPCCTEHPHAVPFHGHVTFRCVGWPLSVRSSSEAAWSLRGPLAIVKGSDSV